MWNCKRRHSKFSTLKSSSIRRNPNWVKWEKNAIDYYWSVTTWKQIWVAVKDLSTIWWANKWRVTNLLIKLEIALGRYLQNRMPNSRSSIPQAESLTQSEGRWKPLVAALLNNLKETLRPNNNCNINRSSAKEQQHPWVKVCRLDLAKALIIRDKIRFRSNKCKVWFQAMIKQIASFNMVNSWMRWLLSCKTGSLSIVDGDQWRPIRTHSANCPLWPILMPRKLHKFLLLAARLIRKTLCEGLDLQARELLVWSTSPRKREMFVEIGSRTKKDQGQSQIRGHSLEKAPNLSKE